ncbi:MAG: serine/threonine-protein kinase [Myxococcota bacterium]
MSSTNRGHVVVDRELELERQEHLAAVGRMRRLMPLAVVLWLGFFFVDWVLATWVVPGSLLPYLGLRVVGVVPILGSWWRLSRPPIPSPRLLTSLDLMMTTSSATILSVMCLLSGGLTSPYATYIAMVLAGRAASMPDPWRTGMVRLGVPALASPVVLALAYPWSSALQAQLLDASARGTYFFYLMLIGGAWGLLVISSHNAWILRRQIFRSRSIGRYRLKRRIGEGGMGEVWVAWDEQLRRDIALKILRPEAGTQPALIARFEREIMATAGLSHPNTVRIFDHGTTDDGLWYYAMELLEGVDLHDLVARDGALPPDRALYLARQAAGALAEAHRRGVVHRDLKPENLFVVELGGETDFVKVLDFGIARLTKSEEPRLTSTGWIAGTPEYVSPEMAAGGEAGPPADVYGLGGVLYFTLTCTPPFEEPNAARLLQLHIGAEPETLSQRMGYAMPPRLEATIMRCLAKSPEDRYADAGELAAALDECIAEYWAQGPFTADEVETPGEPRNTQGTMSQD